MLVSMKYLLKVARAKNFGVAAFNVVSFDQVNSIIKCVEENQSPVIIQTAEGHFPFIDNLYELASYIRYRAQRASVPIALHLDHGESYETVLKAIHYGYTSVMYDGSHLEFEKNVEETTKVVEVCQKVAVTVEAEIGGIGSEGSSHQQADESQLTNPDQAIEFAKRTKIDAIALSFGNVHGHYRGKPNLRFDIIEKVAKGTNLPIVFHGGSGVSETDFKKAINLGVGKINIYTSVETKILNAFNTDFAEHSFANKNILSTRYAVEEMKNHLSYFGSIHKCKEM